jgi:hypothetical protein
MKRRRALPFALCLGLTLMLGLRIVPRFRDGGRCTAHRRRLGRNSRSRRPANRATLGETSRSYSLTPDGLDRSVNPAYRDFCEDPHTNGQKIDKARPYNNPRTVIPPFVPIYTFPLATIIWEKCGIAGKVSRPPVCDVEYSWARVVAS